MYFNHSIVPSQITFSFESYNTNSIIIPNVVNLLGLLLLDLFTCIFKQKDQRYSLRGETGFG